MLTLPYTLQTFPSSCSLSLSLPCTALHKAHKRLQRMQCPASIFRTAASPQSQVSSGDCRTDPRGLCLVSHKPLLFLLLLLLLTHTHTCYLIRHVTVYWTGFAPNRGLSLLLMCLLVCYGFRECLLYLHTHPHVPFRISISGISSCTLLMVSFLTVHIQWWVDPGGSLGSVEPPLLSFCAHASPASCMRTSAVENVLDSRTPPFKILDPPLHFQSCSLRNCTTIDPAVLVFRKPIELLNVT